MIALPGRAASRWVRPDSSGPPLQFSVDSGTGCFVDQGSLQEASALVDDPGQLERDLEQLRAAGWCATGRHADAPAMVVFDCGMGDGGYGIWQGFTEGDELCVLLCDLQLVDHMVALPEPL